MRRAFLTLALVLPLLAACQLSLPGRDRPVAEANPITGGTITTTTLEAAPIADGQTSQAAAAPQTEQAPSTPANAPAPDSTAEAAPDTPPDTSTGTDAGTDAGTEAAPPTPEPPTPESLKSASQIACEKDGGTWARAGAGGGMSCIRQTRDGGKQCDSKTDCQGECLARSRTCAPIQPLFGCNAVLMDNGAEVSLCID
jgi:hypothetical protein